MSRRYFGTVRRLPSGRYQARYRGLDAVMRPAPNTFATKADANAWLVDKEAELRRGEWFDPDAGAELLDEYARRWITERPNLRPRTVALYGSLYRLHLSPGLGRLGLADITSARVRTWRAARLDAGVGPVTVAKAYRLLHAMLGTAVDDGLIRRNPCRIKGASTERTPEREPATLDQVFALAAAMEPRYKAVVLLAAFASLRWGELMGLHRSDLDLKQQTVRVVRAVQELGAKQIVGRPKSDAGVRTVTFPRFIVPELEWHLRVFAEDGDEGRVFIGPKGATPLRSNFQKFWRSATDKAGVSKELHLHDLRHTGATYAAATGASTRELMKRLGHSTPRAALIYQHASEERDRKIADGLDALIDEARKLRGQLDGDPTTGEDDDDPPLVGVGRSS
jgi:integrase